MAWLDLPGMGAAEERTRRALSLPVGAVSPLWLAFGAAAGAGVAFWWMTRWAKPANLEAGFMAAEGAAREATQVIEIVAETVEAGAEEALELLEAAAEDLAAAAEGELFAASEAREPEAPTAPDDLTRLVGIGPKLSMALAERGVTRFAQIAAWTAGDLAEVDAALSLKGRAVRDAWVAQAARLAAA